jgi:hypothetical protein
VTDEPPVRKTRGERAAEAAAALAPTAQELLPPDPLPPEKRAQFKPLTLPPTAGVLQHQAGMNPKQLRRRMRELLSSWSPAAMESFRTLIETGGGDPRVRMVAVKEFMDRTLGQSGALPMGADDPTGTAGVDMDLVAANLDEAELDRLETAIKTVHELVALAQSRIADA